MPRKPKYSNIIPTAVQSLILNLGGTITREISDGLIGPTGECLIETKAGPLKVLATENSILCRFVEIDRAVALLGAHRYDRLSRTGKWNWNGDANDESRRGVVESFSLELARVYP